MIDQIIAILTIFIGCTILWPKNRKDKLNDSFAASARKFNDSN
jgi:hypothetical protein